MRNGNSANEAGRFTATAVLQAVLLALVFCAGVMWEARHLTALRETGIWEHLRVGSWILEHRSAPDTGIYSQAAKLPWRDFSWGFDAIAALWEKLLGLRALPWMLMALRVKVAFIVFLLAGGRRNFRFAMAATLLAAYVLMPVQLLPVYVTVILTGVELWLLLNARRTGDAKYLYTLPVIFLVWANYDIGFVYGILLYAVFAGAEFLEGLDWGEYRERLERPAVHFPPGRILLIGAACVVASVLTPNGWHSYWSFVEFQTCVLTNVLPGYLAMGFREPRDFVLAVAGLGGFLALGLGRSRDLFLLAIMVSATVLAFYSARDNWMLVLATVSVAGAMMSAKEATSREGWQDLRWAPQWMALAAALALSFTVCIAKMPAKRETLLAKVSEKLPVRACDFIRENRMPPPLANPYEWGGFVMWYLPEYPVSIDERRGLYPEDEEVKYFSAMKSDIPYKEYLPMKDARTLLLAKDDVLTEALRGLPGFQTVFEDDVAVVLLQGAKE